MGDNVLIWPDRWERRAAIRNMSDNAMGLARLDAFSGLLYEYHDADGECECVSEHTPVPMHLVQHHIVPLKWDGSDTAKNKIWLCQTAHGNVHRLLWDYERYEGQPPWRGVRWHYSKFIRDLAKTAWMDRNERE